MLFNKNSYYTGLISEFIVLWYLRFHGYSILEHRYITGKNTNRAEIDIIAQKKKLIIFIEVKCHKTLSSAWESISPKQSARLRRAAETYLIKKRWKYDARFDVIMLCKHKIYWAKNVL